MHTEPTKKLDNYELVATPMTLDDVPRLHELSVSVNWPHRAEDWAMLIGLGEGLIARDEIGRAVGSAMWFALGAHHAGVGMVITTPRLQDLGGGRWLMEHILRRVGDRATLLNATRAAYRLYVSLGFTPMGQVYQHNGILRALPPSPDHARPMTSADLPAIHALDSAAMGAERPQVLAALLQTAQGSVVESGGRVTGFSLCRRFGRGHVVGPLVAETEEDAIALVREHARSMEGHFLRLDTRQPAGPFRDFLIQSGIWHHDTVTRMNLGAPPVPRGPARTLALVSQALG